MRILGIDPGTQVCGYGVVDVERGVVSAVDYGVVRSRDKQLARRLKVIYDGLLVVIERFRPDVAVVETPFFGKNVRSALKIGEARGVALLAAAAGGLEVAEYAPAEVKKAVMPMGRGHKEQIQEMVRRILRLEAVPEPEDAADALAMAICHSHRLPRGGC